jgi:hypothetical protein
MTTGHGLHVQEIEVPFPEGMKRFFFCTASTQALESTYPSSDNVLIAFVRTAGA